MMRFLSIVGAVCAAAVTAEPDLNAKGANAPLSLHQQEIAVVDPNRTYMVNLECAGCPFALIQGDGKGVWQQPPQDNALLLEFDIKQLNGHSSPSLLLNGRSILPLEPMPVYLNAGQAPANITTTEMEMFWLDAMRLTRVPMPLQYEHTLLRTEEAGQLWVQFDITGLPLQEMDDGRFPFPKGEPIKLDGEDRKLVQILLRQQKETGGLLIEDIQVVARKDRVQPYRMKCGRFAMVQTAFDPTEWDEYGRIGTYERLWNIAIGKAGMSWSEYFQENLLRFSLVLWAVMGLVVVRRHYALKRQEQSSSREDAEVALLSAGHGDAPPAYADMSIPEIKIEEYH